MKTDDIRKEFPILEREVYGKPLIYLDNAATTQKPRCVIDAISEQYMNVNANVHRGVHFLSEQATNLHESAREKVRAFIGAEKSCEVIFTRGTTESINLVASSFRRYKSNLLHPEVIVSGLEHHSNIVPWQLNGFEVKHFTTIEDLDRCFSRNTTMVSVSHVSNVTGEENDIKTIILKAHEHGVPVMVDGAQSAPHKKINVQDMNCDFFAMSGHKMYGPTGIGVLYGREEWLEKLPPYQGGGEMIDHVAFEKTTFAALPYKFEAGTPDYVGSNALGVATDFLNIVGFDMIALHEQTLTQYAKEHIKTLGCDIINLNSNTSNNPVISFNVPGIHHLDVGVLLDKLGVAVRTGHHCAEPLMRLLGVEGTVRVSVALYNTKEEIDVLVEGLSKIKNMFK